MVFFATDIHTRSHARTSFGTVVQSFGDHQEFSVLEVKKSLFSFFSGFFLKLTLLLSSRPLRFPRTRFARLHSESPVPNHVCQLSSSCSGAPVGRGMSGML